jgi:gluconokinase
MPPKLLASQFAALEPPGPDEHPVTVAIDRPLDRIVAEIAAALRTEPDPSGPPIPRG